MTERSLRIAATIAMAACVLAFWPGLGGPLMLDDAENFGDLWRMLAGELSPWTAIFNNRSGALGRPVSMATFVANALTTGESLYAIKLTNLAIHVLCALLVFRLLRRVLEATGVETPRAGQWALLGTLLWSLHPMQVSTVLYAVQRMTQLSALFVLAGLVLYVEGRQQMRTQPRAARLKLLVALPVAAAFAALAKENGLLLVPLIGVAELCLFLREDRPKSINALLVLLLVVPGLIVAGYLLGHPNYFQPQYEHREFTLDERLLTQPRVLLDYLGVWLAPQGPAMGLYHDDFVISRSLFAPATTLPALLGVAGAAMLAIAARSRWPLLAFGILFYLAGHALEAGPFALELYFEHRNYLPSLGLVAIVLQALLGASGLKVLSARIEALLGLGLLAIAVTLALATYQRASVWGDAMTLYVQELANHPNSPRLRATVAAMAMEAGDHGNALFHIEAAERLLPASRLAEPALWRMLAACLPGQQAQSADYERLARVARGEISQNAMVAWERLVDRLVGGHCTGVERSRVLPPMLHWLQMQPESLVRSQPVWRGRYNSARLLAYGADLQGAEALARRAYHDSGYNNGVGVFLFQLNASLGNWDRCREVLQRLRLSHGSGDHALDRAIDALTAGMPRESK